LPRLRQVFHMPVMPVELPAAHVPWMETAGAVLLAVTGDSAMGWPRLPARRSGFPAGALPSGN
jgi:hypothetical protein